MIDEERLDEAQVLHFTRESHFTCFVTLVLLYSEPMS